MPMARSRDSFAPLPGEAGDPVRREQLVVDEARVDLFDLMQKGPVLAHGRFCA